MQLFICKSTPLPSSFPRSVLIQGLLVVLAQTRLWLWFGLLSVSQSAGRSASQWCCVWRQSVSTCTYPTLFVWLALPLFVKRDSPETLRRAYSSLSCRLSNDESIWVFVGFCFFGFFALHQRPQTLVWGGDAWNTDSESVAAAALSWKEHHESTC